MNKTEATELISRRRRQFMVHSYLYYMQNTSIIDDTLFDKWCKELSELQIQYPDVAKKCPYHDLTWGDDGHIKSGFHIVEYPLNIISVALRLLSIDTGQDFLELLSRNGLSIDDGKAKPKKKGVRKKKVDK